MSVKTVKRNSSGYVGLILSVLVILGFVLYAWTQLGDRNGVEAYESAAGSGNASEEAVWRRTNHKKAVVGIYRRGSSKIMDAKQVRLQHDARPTRRRLLRQQ